MIYDLGKIKKMFADGDALINERPELLTMHIDQIFDELDDGTGNDAYSLGGYDTCKND